MTRRQLLLLVVMAATILSVAMWPRPRSDAFASYELAPSPLVPGPLLKLHTLDQWYPLGTVSPEAQATPTHMMTLRTPGVFRKMMVPGSPTFAIRNERNGLFLNGTNPAVRGYGMPIAGWGPRASLWTAQPANPAACRGQPSFFHLLDEAGRALKVREQSVKGPAPSRMLDRRLTMYVERQGPKAEPDSCWAL